jgi:RimJ/RimL family protein N-acetyltransferase/catechol 2,3-dioxygenase-like lactoylglutathione lyase family enzyme
MKQSIIHVAVVVRDYDEAIAFYCGKLHFTLVEDEYQPEQDKRWVVVAPPGSGGTTLLLARASRPEQEAFIGRQTGGRVFLFLSTDDFWRDYHGMRAAGIPFVREPKLASYGTVAVFRDLYGNLWDLVEPRRPAPLGLEVILETERLRLRPFGPEDADAYADMCADPELMRYLSATGEVLSREDAWRQMAMFVGHWQLRGFGMWAVEERETRTFVGRIGLHYPDGWPDRELGWALRRRFWGQGLASEGARAAADYAFRQLGWTHLISLILPGNARSIRVAERLGAARSGVANVRGAEHLVYRLAAPA